MGCKKNVTDIITDKKILQRWISVVFANCTNFNQTLKFNYTGNVTNMLGIWERLFQNVTDEFVSTKE